MGGAGCFPSNNNSTEDNQNNQVIKNEEKKLGKSMINSLLGKLELFERKEIPINIESPANELKISKRILNTELVKDILHDIYPNYSPDLIVTLNGYIISKELSLKDNLVQENDYIFVSQPVQIYFSFIDGKNEKEYLITISIYQIFFDIFQRFCKKQCPEEYKNKLNEAYYNNRLIQPFDLVWNLGIKQYDKIFFLLGKDNNTKSPYKKGLEIINRINYTYFNSKKKVSVDDNKFELIGQILDDKELKNLGIINFRNLKILVLTECNIKNLEFINSNAFSNLQEINLQKNQISYFVDIIHYKLEKLDLSYNNLTRNMIKSEILENFDTNSSVRLSKILSLVFPRLKYLNLSHNKIQNINLLSQFNSGELKELELSYNEIKNIDAFGFVSFGKLKRLNLSFNKIEELNVFEKLAFCNNIEEINLMNNEIVNLNVLRDASLPKLKILNLLNNDVNDYSVLRLIYFPKLETLYAFPIQLDPDKYDKNSEIFINFKNSCKHIIEKNVEVKYKL